MLLYLQLGNPFLLQLLQNDQEASQLLLRHIHVPERPLPDLVQELKVVNGKRFHWILRNLLPVFIQKL
jgi:hypothetical protein